MVSHTYVYMLTKKGLCCRDLYACSSGTCMAMLPPIYTISKKKSANLLKVTEVCFALRLI